MRPLRAASIALPLSLFASCASRPAPASGGWIPPRTEAELSGYARTTRSADVEAFLDACVARAPDVLRRVSIGRTEEGRDLAAVIAGSPPPESLEAVARSGRPAALVMANIHAGEVEGKEASLTIVREIAEGRHRGLLDRVVAVFLPNYNADGNERVDRRNRPDQAGPVEGVGSRPNANGLDLNRDFVKVAAKETRALLAAARAMNALLVIDCHATNGSFHGYDLTYAGPLNPGTDPELLELVRDAFLPAVRLRMAAEGFRTFDYGNWVDENDPAKGWATFEPRPRFGNSYFGLRNRLTLLSEAYSHDPFEKRIAATRALTLAGLAELARRGESIAAACAAADRRGEAGVEPLPTRSELQFTRAREPVPVGSVIETPDPVTGLVRQWDSNVSRDVEMPVYLHFDGVGRRPLPAWGWAVRRPSGRLLEAVAAHGLRFRRLERAARAVLREFVVAEAVRAATPFQDVRLTTWRGGDRVTAGELPEGTLVIPSRQPAARLAFSLFEPESEDGFGTWGLLGAETGADGASTFEALRLETAPDAF
ncbi:MAG TPA: M14 family metallopeptidase [Planctomycetota bacterium]|nr:M14 family metallopeptidase [Planctomycetota bacterium]